MAAKKSKFGLDFVKKAKKVSKDLSDITKRRGLKAAKKEAEKRIKPLEESMKK